MRLIDFPPLMSNLTLIFLIVASGSGCKLRSPQKIDNGSAILSQEDDVRFVRLIALGYDSSVARRIVADPGDLLSKILSDGGEGAKPRVSYRGIGVHPQSYDPTLRTGGYSYDGIYTAKDPHYSLRYMNDNNGYAVLLEFQTPVFMAQVNPPADPASFIDSTEILLPRAAFPDDRLLLKCFGIKKKGAYDVRKRLTLEVVYWFSYDQAFNAEGKFREEVLKGWESEQGSVPNLETAPECVSRGK